MVFSLAAFKCNAVYKAFKVNDYRIAFLNRTVCHLDRTCLLVSYIFKLCGYFFIRNGNFGFCNCNAFVFSQFHIWLYCHFCHKYKFTAFFNLCNFDIRARYNIQAAFFHCLRIFRRYQWIGGILIKHLWPVCLFDHGSWNLPFTKARNVDSAFLLLISFLHCLFKLVSGNRNSQLCHVLF